MRKLTVILCLLVTLTSAAEPLCDVALRSCEAEVLKLQDLTKAQETYAALLKGQRDQAYKDLEKAGTPSLLPWWGWALLGAAGFEITRSLVK